MYKIQPNPKLRISHSKGCSHAPPDGRKATDEIKDNKGNIVKIWKQEY